MRVLGKLIDHQTRCEHYHSPLDVIAIKFKCCREYYPCISCHEETSGHPAQVWPATEFGTKAVLCGVCNLEMTIDQYLNSGSTCPTCGARFNPGCLIHSNFYFERQGA